MLYSYLDVSGPFATKKMFTTETEKLVHDKARIGPLARAVERC